MIRFVKAHWWHLSSFAFGVFNMVTALFDGDGSEAAAWFVAVLMVIVMLSERAEKPRNQQPRDESGRFVSKRDQMTAQLRRETGKAA